MKVANAAVRVLEMWKTSAVGLRPSAAGMGNVSLRDSIVALEKALSEFKDLEQSPELFEKMTEELQQFEQDLSTGDH
jgi:hypothetical protein